MSKFIFNDKASNIFSVLANKNIEKLSATMNTGSLSSLFEVIKDNEAPIEILVGNHKESRVAERLYTSEKRFNSRVKESWPTYSIISRYDSLIERLEWDEIVIKLYKKPNSVLNARSYLINDNELIVGSSNLFNTNENENIEINYEFDDTNRIKEYKTWFSSIFSSPYAEDIKDGIVDEIKQLTKPLSKNDMLAKVISKLFDEDWEQTHKISLFMESPWFTNLWPHQQVAVSKALKVLEHDDKPTFLIADEVGLGKTASAVAIAAYYSKFARGGVKVLAPKHIVSNNWDVFKREVVRPFKEKIDVHATSLSDLIKDEDRASLTDVSFDNVKLLIIDESQYLKTEDTKSVERYFEITKDAINNGMKVLLLTATPVSNNLMELYNQLSLGGNSPELNSWSKIFKKYDQELKDMDKDFEFSEEFIKFIRGRMIARTKSELKSRSNSIKLPLINSDNVSQIVYDAFEAQDEIRKCIRDFKNENLINHLEEFGMIKRLEESLIALKTSLEKRYSNDEEIPKIPVDKSNELIKLLNKAIKNDPKIVKLKELLHKEKKRFIIFSSSVPTIEYIYKQLVEEFPNKTIAFIHGNDCDSTLSTKYKADELIYLSAPQHNKKRDIQDKEIDILILSNAYAEGQNIQSFQRLINYDLTWNPMILQQRLGRIYRIGSPYEEVYLYNFWPHNDIREFLGLNLKFTAKANKANVISDLPDIFGFKEMLPDHGDRDYEEDGIKFRKEKLAIISEINPLELISRNAKISSGWYTVLDGSKNELYNLFKSLYNNKYYLIQSELGKEVSTNSNRNLIKFKDESKMMNEIKSISHEQFDEKFFEKYNDEIKRHIASLNKLTGNTEEEKQFELISTIFVESKGKDE